MGALLFLITASALTIVVIYDSVTREDTPPTQQTACSIDGSVVTDVTLPVPEAYKSEGKVETLKSEDLEQGKGTAAKNGDCLQMKYYGSLASNGELFDENFTEKTLLQFQLGSQQVIAGWDQGVTGMKEGGVRRLSIPASLGYGEQAQGSIPANSDLVFVIKLIKIKK
jgi:FKBP-type peptidyl-prolyl cis-trans isomerase